MSRLDYGIKLEQRCKIPGDNKGECFEKETPGALDFEGYMSGLDSLFHLSSSGANSDTESDADSAPEPP